MMPVGTAADPRLVSVMRRMRSDPRSDAQPTELASTFNIEFSFGSGDGVSVPTPGALLIWAAGRLSARLVAAELIADQPSAATVDIRIGNMASWPTAEPIYNFVPTMTVDLAAVELDVTLWTLDLRPYDILRAQLLTVGAPTTTITLVLVYRRIRWPAVTPSVVNTGGDTIIVTSGDPVTVGG